MYFFKDRFDLPQGANAAIGLDIGTHTIKWVSLSGTNELIQYAIQKIPISLAIAQKKDIPKIAGVLKETLLNHNYIKNCIINIPDILACCKCVQLDSIDYQNIKVLAEKLIPYPLSKVYFDYQVLDLFSENQKKYNVLLVACRKDHLDFRLEIIQQANLIPIVVELSSFALERAYNFFYTSKLSENFILLDVGQPS